LSARNDRLGALHGIRVLDLAGTVATGYCGKLFADQGADVLLVEPPEGCPTRRLPPFAAGVPAPEASGMHAYLSANKRSVVCPDHTALTALARDAALVIDDRVGRERTLTQEALEKCSANGVLLSITWFGQSGPYRDYAGADGVCQALTSQIDWLGEPEGPPVIPGGYQAQMIAGVTAFVASMGQILARELGNVSGSDHLDVSVLEANLCFAEIECLRGFAGKPTRERLGVNRFRATYPLGIYPCRDGWLGVTVLTPSQWDGFCKLLGFDDLAAVDRYQQSLERLRDADKLEGRILERVARESATDLAKRGQALRVPLTIVPTMDQLFDVDQFVERGAFADVAHPDLGSLRMPTTPFRLHATPAVRGGNVAPLGAHTQVVLQEAEAAL
jgi:crotonobetainyl-CoA:carnitine CoA-transferase CaiB-like acyl-CoA transferase